MAGVMVHAGDLVFIDTRRVPPSVRFVAPTDVGPDPVTYGLDNDLLYQGVLEVAGEDPVDCKIRTASSVVVDLALYTIARGYPIAED